MPINTKHLPLKIIFATFIFAVFLFSPSMIYAALGPSLELESSSSNLILGSTHQINIIVDTADQLVAGIGTKINYDPKYIKVISITKGNILNTYTKNEFNNTEGLIQISAITNSLENQFTGRGILATYSFEVLQVGETTFNINFTPGSTTDSNIAVTTGEGDILAEVKNMTLTITTTNLPTTSHTNNNNNLSHLDVPTPTTNPEKVLISPTTIDNQQILLQTNTTASTSTDSAISPKIWRKVLHPSFKYIQDSYSEHTYLYLVIITTTFILLSYIAYHLTKHIVPPPIENQNSSNLPEENLPNTQINSTTDSLIEEPNQIPDINT